MRVTKNKLRDIIREALENNDPQEAIEKLEDIELVEPEDSDDELVHHLDYSKIMTGESSVDHPEVLDVIVKEVKKRIAEKKDQNKDGENDFDDVKIARMKASGMSDEEIKKKHPDLFKEDIGELVGKVIARITDEPADEDGRDLGYGEGEGRMSKAALDKLARYSQSLHDKIRDEDDLPEWVQSKIAVSAENIGKVYHYLDYKMKRMEDK
tara:strand:- start:10317 stop:10946 length:630 start_codon:yes stop_codon:yes gene_type:complete